MIRLFFFFLFISCAAFAHPVQGNTIKKHYDLTNDPIDVIIVTHPKDQETLEDCIAGIKEYCNHVGRIIVVSPKKLTDNAEWFDEKNYPFTKEEIAMKVVGENKKRYKEFFTDNHRSPGWYFQQMLKLYAIFVIPGISPNIMVVDADTIFMNPVELLNEQNGGLFCYGDVRVMPQYFDHAQRLLPDYKRIYPRKYSVCHHMVFQRPILEDLFHIVEQHHGVPFWEAFNLCVDKKENLGASEFEIYFNFALRNTDQVQLRKLKWRNSAYMKKRETYRKQGYHFVSFHSYMRNAKSHFPFFNHHHVPVGAKD